MKRTLLVGLLLIISTVSRSQQDPQFSQNRFNLLTINPGSAGYSGLINVALLNRFQWIGFPGAPVTTVFNADASVRIIGANDGIGISMMNDVIGYEKNVSMELSYSWRRQLGAGQLGSGISLGLLNKNLKPGWSGAEGSDLINSSDPALPMKETNGVVADFGIGFYYQHPNYYWSVSAKHLNQPRFSYEQNGSFSIRRSYYLTGGYNLRTANEKIELLPSAFVKTDGAAFQSDIDLILQYDQRIWGGFGIRPGDAVIFQLGTELRNGIRFGYAYDLSTSALSAYNSGSHEIYLSYSFALEKRKTHKYRSIRFL